MLRRCSRELPATAVRDRRRTGHGAGGHTRARRTDGARVPPTRRAHAAPPCRTVPLVPAPPVAAVLRPSTWSGPAVDRARSSATARYAPVAPATRGATAAAGVQPRAAPPNRPPAPRIEPPRRRDPGCARGRGRDGEDRQRRGPSDVRRARSPRGSRARATGARSAPAPLRFTLQRSPAPTSAARATPRAARPGDAHREGRGHRAHGARRRSPRGAARRSPAARC